MKAARLWLLTLTDAAPHLEHQGLADTLPLEQVQPPTVAPAPITKTAEGEAEADVVETVEEPVVARPVTDMTLDLPDEPYRVRPDFNLADGWNADRMTRTLNQLSASETDRRSQALLRTLEWADA